MQYGIEQPREAPPPSVRLPVKVLMVTVTGLLDLLIFERFGRAVVTGRLVWSVGVVLLCLASIAILTGMHLTLLWKWTCQKCWKAFSCVFLLAAVLPGSIGFYVGLKSLWESSH
jgi:hypothetical protein